MKLREVDALLLQFQVCLEKWRLLPPRPTFSTLTILRTPENKQAYQNRNKKKESSMLQMDLVETSSSVSFSMDSVRKRLESESESPPSLEPCCDLSVSTIDENYRDPAPVTTSRTSANDLPFNIFSEIAQSWGVSSHDRNENELKETTVVKELQPTKDSKKVRFDTCTIRFMPLIAGDHPDCAEGPPLTIDWEPIQEVTFSVDYYEQNRLKPRSENNLRVGGLDRRRLLKSSGESDEQIREAQRESRIVRHQREKTLSRLSSSKVEEFRELIARKIRYIVHSKVVLKTKY